MGFSLAMKIILVSAVLAVGAVATQTVRPGQEQYRTPVRLLTTWIIAWIVFSVAGFLVVRYIASLQ